MKSAAIIYGRTGSTRFPGKCFAKIGQPSMPLAHWVVLRAAKLNVDEIVFATTNSQSDDELVCSLKELNVPGLKFFRGDETNVVKRTIDCLSMLEIDLFARINGDSPFFPVNEINLAFDSFKKNSSLKMLSNLKKRTYPYGVAVEVINAKFYFETASLTQESELEHTTQHLYRIASDQIEAFNEGLGIKMPSFTVDTVEDFDRLQNMIISQGLDFNSDWKDLL